MDLGLDITRDATDKLNADFKQKKKDLADPNAARRRAEKEAQAGAYGPPQTGGGTFNAAKFLKVVEPGSPPRKSASKIDTKKRDAEIAELVSWKRKYTAYVSKPQLMKHMGKIPKPGQESVAEYRRCVGEIRSALNAQNASRMVRDSYPKLVGFFVVMVKFSGLEASLDWDLPPPDLVELCLRDGIQQGQLDTEILEAECELQEWFAQCWQVRLVLKTALILQTMNAAQQRQARPASDALRRFAASQPSGSAQ